MREYPGALSQWLGVTRVGFLIVPLLVVSPQAAPTARLFMMLLISRSSARRAFPLCGVVDLIRLYRCALM